MTLRRELSKRNPAALSRAHVASGFHLFDAEDEQLDWTADKLKEFEIAQMLGAHCTGIESLYHLRQRLGLDRQSCAIGTVGAIFDLKDGIHTTFY